MSTSTCRFIQVLGLVLKPDCLALHLGLKYTWWVIGHEGRVLGLGLVTLLTTLTPRY